MWIDEIRRLLARRPAERIGARAGFRVAAVLVPMFVAGGQLWLIFTRRSDALAGEGPLSFPGSGRDAGGQERAAAALSGAGAETGLDPGRIIVLGELNEVVTADRAILMPVVGALAYPFDAAAAGTGVEAVARVPIAYLAAPELVEERVIRSGRRRFLFPSCHYRKLSIIGPTAAILSDLLGRLSAWREVGGEQPQHS